jgi:light-harvesting complex 1 beta chain
MAYAHVQHHHENQSSASQTPLKEYRYLFFVLFCVFTSLAVIGQVLFMEWRSWLPGAEGSRSMFESVKSAVYTVISQLS